MGAKSSPAEPSPEARSLPCEEMSTNDEFSAGENIPGFSSMDIERQEAIKRSLSYGQTERRRLARKKRQNGVERLKLAPYRRALLFCAVQSWRSGYSEPLLRNSTAVPLRAYLLHIIFAKSTIL